MSSNSVVLKAFNKHFFEFIDDVIRIFPENTHIQTSRDYFETIKKANPTLLVKIWHYFIWSNYKEKIEEGDLSFFFDKDYTEDVKMMPNSEEIVRVINTTLRDPLKAMDDVNRGHCCRHFQLVSRLCAKYCD
jgi:hypothetical protein